MLQASSIHLYQYVEYLFLDELEDMLHNKVIKNRSLSFGEGGGG
jgi:hypothetical protein